MCDVCFCNYEVSFLSDLQTFSAKEKDLLHTANRPKVKT